MRNKFAAFTLAEVLVTLGIIGVVSVLTMPSLVNNHQRKTLALQIRRVTNDIVNAADLYTTEEGKPSFGATGVFTKTDGIDSFIAAKFKTIKTCSGAGCFGSQKYESINGTKTATVSCSGKSYVLANSAVMCVTLDEGVKQKAYNKDATDSRIAAFISNLLYPAAYAQIPNVTLPSTQTDAQTGSSMEKVDTPDLLYAGKSLLIKVDTNGSNGPNIGGRDMFVFNISPKGELFSNDSSSKCTDSAFGEGCINKLLDSNWNMDY